ncbi:hypothetical protein PQ676_07200 [Rickettsia felis]|uniref:Uncharacterized protein n=2 Tax=Rickettsia felis TaxID=42862 RepID=Q4UJC9_RICFE|nr:hypothetical protein [Rickettsia felis]AAY62260.1 unknown [Rickettsia felis URRWXCal2]KHO02178.1 hypothetical protein JS55_07920 [Rickettsia felis str. LSU]AAY62328.1 unknown [Rickettsia felis URRWXCal2]KHO02395.1 hypothetical protein JS61_07690 [Rickettsia felis]MDE8611977.1 hypothetical protein [Rickettsia felis]
MSSLIHVTIITIILYVPKNKHITISDLSIYDGITLVPKSGVYSKMDETRVFNKEAFETIELEINPPDTSSNASDDSDGISSTSDQLSSDSSSVLCSSCCSSLDISDFLSSDDDMDLTGNNAADLANN